MVSQLEDYEVLNIIGTGSFGTCYKVRKKSEGNVYVWKAIDYGKMAEERKQLLVSEVNLLSELRHPNIVCYYDRILHRQSTTLYIIMEYCQGGDLASLINKCKQTSSYVDEDFVWKVLYQTGKALQVCHSKLCHMTVVHRDIKPANVFLDSNGNVKLGDFGLARILHGENSYSETIVGTPYYMSPEVIKGTKYNRKSDIWALGCLVYELCALKPPFAGTNLQQLATSIKDGLFVRIPQHYSDHLQKIIELMLSVDHDFRPTVEMILHHPTVVLHVPYRTFAQHGKYESKKFTEKTKYPCKLDVKEVTEKVNALKLLEREPRDVSEDTFQEKWMIKLEALRQKEANLRKKEEGLCYKERQLLKKERQLSLMERAVKEKMSRAEVYLRQCKSSLTSTSVKSTRLSTFVEDFDTSYSADPGDTSVLPTSAKLDTEFLQPLNHFNRIGSLQATKRVHFDQPCEVHSADKTLILPMNSNLAQKSGKPVENVGCLTKKYGLKLKNVPSLTEHNDEALNKRLANLNQKSRMEDKTLELEKRRFIFCSSYKENLDVNIEKEDMCLRKKGLKYDTPCSDKKFMLYR